MEIDRAPEPEDAIERAWMQREERERMKREEKEREKAAREQRRKDKDKDKILERLKEKEGSKDKSEDEEEDGNEAEVDGELEKLSPREPIPLDSPFSVTDIPKLEEFIPQFVREHGATPFSEVCTRCVTQTGEIGRAPRSPLLSSGRRPARAPHLPDQ